MTGISRGCFLPETLVSTPNGLRRIEDLRVGDTVSNYFTKNSRVEKTFCYDVNEEIVSLEFEGGKVIECTKDHKFLTENRGWVKAEDLTCDDTFCEL